MLETYREDYDRALRTAERLATLGQFAGTLAHEMRNPLAVLSTSSHLLRRNAGDQPNVLRHVDRIERQIAVCGQIVDDLLALARDRPPSFETVELRPLFEFAWAQLPGHAPLALARHRRRRDGAQRGREPAAPGAGEPAAERDAGHERAGRREHRGDAHHAGRAARRGAAHPRRRLWRGLLGRRARAPVRAALHDQGPGHRPRPAALPARGRQAPGHALGGQPRAARREGGHRPAVAQKEGS
jgi:hypothetical protein